MPETEAPLSPVERLVIASLYTRLVQSQNRTVPGQLGSESACYADLNVCSPETLSHNGIPAIRPSGGFRTEEAC